MVTDRLWWLDSSAGHKQTYGSATLEQKDDIFLATRNYLIVQTALHFCFWQLIVSVPIFGTIWFQYTHFEDNY